MVLYELELANVVEPSVGVGFGATFSAEVDDPGDMDDTVGEEIVTDSEVDFSLESDSLMH